MASLHIGPLFGIAQGNVYSFTTVAYINSRREVGETVHRAFDRGLVTVDENYCIVVSKHVREQEQHAYSLNILNGNKLFLPQDNQYYPAQDNLSWHRREVFK